MESGLRETLKRMFCPSSVAVIGASPEAKKFGGTILRALLKIGYEGRIYPVNPRGGEAFGLKFYPDLKSIGEPVDLAFVSVPREKVASALKDCLANGIPGAEVLTAGFGEVDDGIGPQLQNEVVEVARQGIRVLGPNCFGVYCPRCGLTIVPGDEFSRTPGPVAFISQSGGVCADIGHLAKGYGINFSQMVSYGNACDINEADLLEYFAEDGETRIISAYIEGVRDGRRFLEAAKRAARVKPLIIWKSALSETGSRAAAGHTGAMAGDRALWQGLAKQAGITLVNDLYELLEATMAFMLLPAFTGDRLAVIGGGGAISVLAADLAEEYGLRIPPFAPEVKKSMEQILPPPGNNLANPADVGNPSVTPARLEPILKMAAALEDIDAIAVVQIPTHIIGTKLRLGAENQPLASLGHHHELTQLLCEVRRESGKPIIMELRNIEQGADRVEMENVWREFRDISIKAGMPVYPDLRKAFRALSSVKDYYRFRQKLISQE